MSLYRTMIIVGQLGRIWTKSYKAKQIYQTISTVGYFALMTKIHNRGKNEFREQVFTIGNQTVVISQPFEVQVTPLKLKNFKQWK